MTLVLKGHLSGLSEGGTYVKGSPVRVIKSLAFMPSCQPTVRDVRGWYCTQESSARAPWG